jgi:hypothetical protein
VSRWLTVLVVLSAAPAFAQEFEAGLLGGYTTAGGLEAAALDVDDLRLAGGFTWGATVGCFFSPRFGVEASWTRDGSDLEIETPGGSAELFDVDVDQLQGSFVYRFGAEQASWRPFVSVGAGAAFFSAPDLDGETKLSFGLGAGVRWLPTKRVGARLQARYVPTHLSDSDSEFCDPFGFCQGWLHQLEVTGGVSFRF